MLDAYVNEHSVRVGLLRGDNVRRGFDGFQFQPHAGKNLFEGV